MSVNWEAYWPYLALLALIAGLWHRHEARDGNFPFPRLGLGNVVVALHVHELIHRNSEGLLYTQCHFGG